MDRSYSSLMVKRINEFYKGFGMLDITSLLSSPPKSSETGEKGHKKCMKDLSTGGAGTDFFVSWRYRKGKLCYSCKNRAKVGNCSEKAAPFTINPILIKNNKKKKPHFIIYLPGSKTHDMNVMGNGNRPLKEFKAAKRQTPNLPSPPFWTVQSRSLGPICSLDPIIDPEAQRKRLKKAKVTSFISLCLWGGCG